MEEKFSDEFIEERKDGFKDGFNEGLYKIIDWAKGETEMNKNTMTAVDFLANRYMMEELTDEQIKNVNDKVDNAINTKEKILSVFPKAVEEAMRIANEIPDESINSYGDFERAFTKMMKGFLNTLKKEITFKELTTIDNYIMISEEEVTNLVTQITKVIDNADKELKAEE